MSDPATIAGEDKIAIENAREAAEEAAFPSETHAIERSAKPTSGEPPLKRLRALMEEKDGMERVLEDDGEDAADPAATETTGIAGPTPLADRGVVEEVADAAARVAAAARRAAAAEAGGGGGLGSGEGEDKDSKGPDDASAVAAEEAAEARRDDAVIDALADAEADFEGAEEAARGEKINSSSSSQQQQSLNSSARPSFIDEATREKVRVKLEAALEKADDAAAAAAAAEREKGGGGGGGDGGGDNASRAAAAAAARLRRSEIAASVEAEAAKGSTSRSVYFSKVGNAARLAASSALPLPYSASLPGKG